MSTDFEAFIERAQRRPDNEVVLPNAESQPAAQGSAAWLYERVGFVTASRFQDVIAKTKAGKPTAEREKYLMELVVERITGQPQDHFTSAAMQWGQDTEQRSRMDYEAQTGRMIEEVGFLKHPTLPMVGGSPDGLIGEDGGWESKSPFNSGVHIRTLLDGMPEEHIAQCQGLMWITGRKWWDFQSFDPRLPEPLCRYTKRIERDDKYITALESEVITFSAEVAAMVGRLAVFAEWAAGGTPPSKAAPLSAPSAASATSETDALLMLAREWADQGAEKYAAWFDNLSAAQQKHIGKKRHDELWAIAEKVAA